MIREQVSIHQIAKLHENGLSYRELSDIFGVSIPAIHGIIKRYYNGNFYLSLNSSICEKLNMRLYDEDVSLAKYSKSIGMSYCVLRKILLGETKSIRYNNAKQIAKFLRVPLKEVVHIGSLKSNPNIPNEMFEATKLTYKEVAEHIKVKKVHSIKQTNIDGLVPISRHTINKIKACRISKGFSCIDFAKTVGISASRISQIENYTASGVRYSTLNKISKVLELSINELISCQEDETDINSADFKVKLNDLSAEKVRKARKKQRLSQRALGEKCGVSQVIISNIELASLKSIKTSILNSICSVLNLNINELTYNI